MITKSSAFYAKSFVVLLYSFKLLRTSFEYFISIKFIIPTLQTGKERDGRVGRGMGVFMRLKFFMLKILVYNFINTTNTYLRCSEN